MAFTIGLLAFFGCFLVVTIAIDIKKTAYEETLNAEEAQKNFETLERFARNTKMSPYDDFIVSSALKRIKREAVPGSNEHWCCKEDPVYGKTYHTRAVGELKPVTKTRQTTKKCGFGGWKRCTADVPYTTQQVTYKSVVDTREVPASEWTNGCPDRKIVCCRGYVFTKTFNQCLTADEVAAFGRVSRENGLEGLCLMYLLGGHPRPEECSMQ